jgi:hypothetical protein
MLLGVRPDTASAEEPAAPCHSNRMIVNESAIPLGAALHAELALRWLAGRS